MSSVLYHCTHAVNIAAWNSTSTVTGSFDWSSLSYIRPNLTFQTILLRTLGQQPTVTHDLSNINSLLALCTLVLILACLGPFWLVGQLDQGCASEGEAAEGSTSCSRTKPGANITGAIHINTTNPLQNTTHITPTRGLKRRDRDDDDEPPARDGSKRVQGKSLRRLACPFYLHSRLEHLNCRTRRFRGISDLKQHLIERTHKQPKHCPSCGEIFTGDQAQEQWRSHVEARICSSIPFAIPPGLSEDEARQINSIRTRYRGAHLTEVDRYFMIWDILFPGEQHPGSPYLDESHEVQLIILLVGDIFNGDQWPRLLPPSMAAMPQEQSGSLLRDIFNRFIGQISGPSEIMATGLGVHTPTTNGLTDGWDVISAMSGSLGISVQSNANHTPLSSTRLPRVPHPAPPLFTAQDPLDFYGPTTDVTHGPQVGQTIQSATGGIDIGLGDDVAGPDLQQSEFQDWSFSHINLESLDFSNVNDFTPMDLEPGDES